MSRTALTRVARLGWTTSSGRCCCCAHVHGHARGVHSRRGARSRVGASAAGMATIPTGGGRGGIDDGSLLAADCLVGEATHDGFAALQAAVHQAEVSYLVDSGTSLGELFHRVDATLLACALPRPPKHEALLWELALVRVGQVWTRSVGYGYHSAKASAMCHRMGRLMLGQRKRVPVDVALRQVEALVAESVLRVEDASSVLAAAAHGDLTAVQERPVFQQWMDGFPEYAGGGARVNADHVVAMLSVAQLMLARRPYPVATRAAEACGRTSRAAAESATFEEALAADNSVDGLLAMLRMSAIVLGKADYVDPLYFVKTAAAVLSSPRLEPPQLGSLARSLSLLSQHNRPEQLLKMLHAQLGLFGGRRSLPPQVLILGAKLLAEYDRPTAVACLLDVCEEDLVALYPLLVDALAADPGLTSVLQDCTLQLARSNFPALGQLYGRLVGTPHAQLLCSGLLERLLAAVELSALADSVAEAEHRQQQQQQQQGSTSTAGPAGDVAIAAFLFPRLASVPPSLQARLRQALRTLALDAPSSSSRRSIPAVVWLVRTVCGDCNVLSADLCRSVVHHLAANSGEWQRAGSRAHLDALVAAMATHGGAFADALRLVVTWYEHDALDECAPELALRLCLAAHCASVAQPPPSPRRCEHPEETDDTPLVAVLRHVVARGSLHATACDVHRHQHRRRDGDNGTMFAADRCAELHRLLLVVRLEAGDVDKAVRRRLDDDVACICRQIIAIANDLRAADGGAAVQSQVADVPLPTLPGEPLDAGTSLRQWNAMAGSAMADDRSSTGADAGTGSVRRRSPLKRLLSLIQLALPGSGSPAAADGDVTEARRDLLTSRVLEDRSDNLAHRAGRPAPTSDLLFDVDSLYSGSDDCGITVGGGDEVIDGDIASTTAVDYGTIARILNDGRDVMSSVTATSSSKLDPPPPLSPLQADSFDTLQRLLDLDAPLTAGRGDTSAPSPRTAEATRSLSPYLHHAGRDVERGSSLPGDGAALLRGAATLLQMQVDELSERAAAAAVDESERGSACGEQPRNSCSVFKGVLGARVVDALVYPGCQGSVMVYDSRTAEFLPWWEPSRRQKAHEGAPVALDALQPKRSAHRWYIVLLPVSEKTTSFVNVCVPTALRLHILSLLCCGFRVVPVGLPASGQRTQAQSQAAAARSVSLALRRHFPHARLPPVVASGSAHDPHGALQPRHDHRHGGHLAG